MFTGIVTDVGRVVAVGERNDVRRIEIASAYDADTIALGASVACAGVCFTVVSVEARPEGGAVLAFEAAPEAQHLTTASGWQVGSRVNLERSLKIGDELGGHMVAGHVDGIARVTEREDIGETVRFTFEAPAELARYIAPKGSVALDGTSLTVNGVDGNGFDCLIIPHTLKVTTWDERRPGDPVNIEVDTVARYVARLVAPAGG